MISSFKSYLNNSWPLLLISLLCLYGILFISSYALNFEQLTYPLFDDGMITLEYAKNFARFHTLTVGGDPGWTAGFTSWAWMLILAGLSIVPVSELTLPLLVPIANVIILICGIYVFSKLSLEISDKKVSRNYWVLVFTTPSILFWTLRGMEVPLSILVVALLVLSISNIAKDQKISLPYLSILFFISLTVFFIRPELSSLVLVGLGYLFVKRRYGIVLTAFSLLIIGFYFYTSVNKLIFNQYFSNSYYLKVVGISLEQKLDRAFWSVGTQLKHHWIYLAVFFAVIAFKINKNACLQCFNSDLIKKILRSPAVAMSLLTIITIFLNWIFVGGDAWEELPILNRFIVCCVPIVYIFLDHYFFSTRSDNKLLLLVIIINSIYSLSIIGLGAKDHKIFSYIGYSLGTTFGDNVKTMHYWYGLPSYYASINNGRSIDGLGKIDPIVSQSQPTVSFKPGHDRWNHQHSIAELQPDLIVNLPCPATYQFSLTTGLPFECNKVWEEITIKYKYTPHTAKNGNLTMLVSPSRPDLNARVDMWEDKFVAFSNSKANSFWSFQN